MNQDSNILTTRLISAISQQFNLSLDGIHGKSHWARVLDNGLRLAALNGANINVVSLFALFHDSQRINDARDDNHGKRGAELAFTMRKRYFDISDHEFDLLYNACELHTDGLTESDITIQTCWDSDRLDLGRVNIELDPTYLCTFHAKEPHTLEWANSRAKARYQSKSLE